MKKAFFAIWVGMAAVSLNVHAHGGKAHVHGNAAMQVAVDGNTIDIALQSPLDSLVGFEHAPRNERQKKALQAMEAQFRAPASLFVPSEAAQCTVQSSEVILPFGSEAHSAAHDKHGKHEHGHEHEHADMEATIRFQCENPAALKGMEVRLFEPFPRLHRLDVQTVSARGQSAARLTPKQRQLQW